MTAPTPATQTTLADWLEVQFAADEAEARRILAVGSCEPAYRPARVLADVAARRAIVALLAPVVTPAFTEVRARDTLRHLAAVYSDSPGYDERWAVS